MPSEHVEILIEAEDNASAKVENTGKAVEKQVKHIKEVGGQAKASTELVGTLATSLGGSELGSYAGQLAMVTERISAFSEVSKAGGAGAMAFKAGLVGVVAVGAVKVGQAIGNVVFQTARWTKELEEATRQAEKLNAAVLAAADTRLNAELEEIDLIRDPAEQEAEMKRLLSQIDRDIQAKNQQIESYRAKVTDAEGWTGWAKGILTGQGEINENNKVQLEEAEKLKDALAAQALEVRRRMSAELQAIETQKQANAEAEKSAAFVEKLRQEVELLKATEEERLEIEAQRNTANRADFGQAKMLMEERDALLAKAEAEKQAQAEAEKAAAAKIADAERIAQVQQNALDNIRQQQIALEQGETAARAFALELQGLDKGTANQIAQAEERLKAAFDSRQKLADAIRQKESEESQEKLASAVGQLSAEQGRLLTRGQSEDPAKKIADNTQATVKELAAANKQLEQMARRPVMQPVRLRVVSA